MAHIKMVHLNKTKKARIKKVLEQKLLKTKKKKNVYYQKLGEKFVNTPVNSNIINLILIQNIKMFTHVFLSSAH